VALHFFRLSPRCNEYDFLHFPFFLDKLSEPRIASQGEWVGLFGKEAARVTAHFIFDNRKRRACAARL
jgi:hypothetical protein